MLPLVYFLGGITCLVGVFVLSRGISAIRTRQTSWVVDWGIKFDSSDKTAILLGIGSIIFGIFWLMAGLITFNGENGKIMANGRRLFEQGWRRVCATVRAVVIEKMSY
ncbi:MAG: hypothetical protein U0528_05630 [Anaerolineae bacterium]